MNQFSQQLPIIQFHSMIDNVWSIGTRMNMLAQKGFVTEIVYRAEINVPADEAGCSKVWVNGMEAGVKIMVIIRAIKMPDGGTIVTPRPQAVQMPFGFSKVPTA